MHRYTLPNRISPGSAAQMKIQTVFFASISLKAAISTALHRMNSMLLSAKSTLAPENALAGNPLWKFFPLPVLHFIDYLPWLSAARRDGRSPQLRKTKRTHSQRCASFSVFGSIPYLRSKSSIASSNRRLFGMRVFFDRSSKSGTSSFFRDEVNLVLYFKKGSAIVTPLCNF